MARLTNYDLRLLLEHAIAYYLRLPPGRLPGETKDMTDSERRALAYLQAAMMCLLRLGAVDEQNMAWLQNLDLRVVMLTAAHDVVDSDTEGMTFPKK